MKNIRWDYSDGEDTTPIARLVEVSSGVELTCLYETFDGTMRGVASGVGINYLIDSLKAKYDIRSLYSKRLEVD